MMDKSKGASFAADATGLLVRSTASGAAGDEPGAGGAEKAEEEAMLEQGCPVADVRY